jgi:hypothetical protein
MLILGETTPPVAFGMPQLTWAELRNSWWRWPPPPATETSWGLLAVGPDMAETLAVAFYEAGLCFVSFELHSDVTEAGES